MIPLAYEDFTFAAIAEEFGILFAVCLILLCMGMYLLIVNIAMRLEKPFYKLVALGLGSEYAFQVFLTIGGTTKFIPMTGITLPLVSYGGSSIMCTIIMLSIIQGLYIVRKDENRQELAGIWERMENVLEERERRERPGPDPGAGPQDRFDPYTGAPVQARYHPYTGEPLQDRFDPYTGRPLQGPQIPQKTETQDELERRIEKQAEESIAFRDH